MGVAALSGILVVLLSLGCAEESSEAQTAPSADPPPRSRQERPLPAFEGVTLSGESLGTSELLGRRLVLFFFAAQAPEAEPVAKAMASVARLRGKHNFDVLGIGTGPSRDALEGFVAKHDLDFRTLDDSRGAIGSRLGLDVPVAVIGVDAEGYVSFGVAHFATDVPDAAAAAESQIREQLRLPSLGTSLEPMLGEKPPAPDFRADRLGSDERFDSTSLRGKPAILVFFLHTCPHCHSALKAMKEPLAGIPEETRPQLVGISLLDRPSAVRRAMAEQGLEYFPIVFDADSRISTAYGATGGTPDIFVLDAEGRVVARVRGWRDDRDPPLMRMRIARLAGRPTPMLLHKTGYSGDEFCGVCHELEYETHQLTSHSWAFDTLVEHAADRNGECVGCHVVGFGEPGGFQMGGRTPHLEDVGCESCHGRGGPHLSPGFVKNDDYASVCITCHDTKHSLGFDFTTFRPKISHAGNAHLLELDIGEKRRLLAERAALRTDLLPEDARYVGSDACRECHQAEYETWSRGGHARALASLEREQKAGSADCLKCHTTGFGRPGGFPSGAAAEDHPDLARVGCESCHGPGEAHVAAAGPKRGSIVSLGDKCDSCVILQICGACHDDANDPGFEFEVQQKIDAQRHGTIEPGTGKTKPDQARLSHPSAVLGTLEQAFAQLQTSPWTNR